MKSVTSQDGKTTLEIDDEMLCVRNEAGEIIERPVIARNIVLAAISNNRRLIAFTIDEIVPRVYLAKKEEGNQSGHLTKMIAGNINREITNLAWDDQEDQRYPPYELIVTLRDGQQKRFMPQ